jgi:hypothetical protein
VKPVASIDTVASTAAKRGRKPGVKNKPKATVKMPKTAEKLKAVPAKRGPKPKAKAVESSEVVVKPVKPVAKKATKKATNSVTKPVAKSAAKPAVKRGPKPKITLETVSDEGLPTLNKVLEAYAKSSGPRGKVGEIN